MTTNESKQEKFIRLAERRTNEILERIRILGHCSNKSHYEWDDSYVNKIFSAIETEVKACKLKFRKVNHRKLKL